MFNVIEEFRMKNRAAYDFMRELIVNSFGGDESRKKAIANVLEYLRREAEQKGYEAVDLNQMFRFVLYKCHVLVIPRPRLGRYDFLVLKNLHPEAKEESLSSYLKQDKRGWNHEFVAA